MKDWLWVGSGGMIGALLRHICIQHLPKLHPIFNADTAIFAVNIAGSFIMGLLFGEATHPGSINRAGHMFFAVGLLGSFTTFSTFSALNHRLLAESDIRFFLLHFIGQPLIGLTCFTLAFTIAKQISS